MVFGCMIFSPLSIRSLTEFFFLGNDILLDIICHSDDRREEDVLLSVAKNLGNKMVGVNVDVLEILRFALNDTCVNRYIVPFFYSSFVQLCALCGAISICGE